MDKAVPKNGYKMLLKSVEVGFKKICSLGS